MNKNECLICLMDITNDEFILKCNHHFHADCIIQWFKDSDTCPLCRESIINKNTKKIITNTNTLHRRVYYCYNCGSRTYEMTPITFRGRLKPFCNPCSNFSPFL